MTETGGRRQVPQLPVAARLRAGAVASVRLRARPSANLAGIAMD